METFTSILNSDKVDRRGNKQLGMDWILFFAIVPLLGAGLFAMSSFVGTNYFFTRQLLWISISLVIFFTFSRIDWRFLKKTSVLISLYSIALLSLLLLFVVGVVVVVLLIIKQKKNESTSI